MSLNPKVSIIGVDEAGRGCLCGPVYAAAVIFKNTEERKGLVYKDSKLLTAVQREKIFEDIVENHWVGVGSANCAEVDSINILQATFLAMRRAVLQLKEKIQDDKLNSSSNPNHLQFIEDSLNNAFVVIDGNQKIPNFVDFKQTTLIKGDQLLSEISAASIVAKVSRDRYVDELDAKYPGYEFSKHKGYGTALHKQKIEQLGPCPEHRTTFKGVREFLHLMQEQSN